MVERAGAAYLVLRNSGVSDDALVAVTSPAAAAVELHETVADPSSGMMGMQPVASIPVPAGGTTELKQGGYHMMLIDLVAPLVEGTTIELTLTFQGGTVLTVPAEVRSGMPMGSAMPMGSSMPTASMGAACRWARCARSPHPARRVRRRRDPALAGPRRGLALALGLALAATGSSALAASPAVSPAQQTAQASDGLQPMVVSTQLWVGANDLLFDLLDPAGVRWTTPT